MAARRSAASKRIQHIHFMTHFRIILALFCLCSAVQLLSAETSPNLVIIYTDEHNFRTLGCYRELLSEEEGHVWGKGVKVDTPHIDSIADSGTLLTSFYVATPVCSPSRASILSGLYPHATGVPTNDLPMNADVLTFAQALQNNGYATSFIGKWHLDGEAKPGWAPERKFGFEDNRYMYNRGHWKKFEETDEGPRVAALDKKGNPSYDLDAADEKTYATDFLMDRTIEFIDTNKSEPFCVMLSLPDPHGPNRVRPPYDTRFDHLEFESPRTMFKSESEMPGWAAANGNNFIWAQTLERNSMSAIFGMVQCIDDNVGKLLDYLRNNNLEEDTIVVFTSDHGDLMGEHRRHNKGLPYETSACVAFMLKYPKAVASKKVIRSTMTSADFAPTVLSLMGFEGALPDAHGSDLSSQFRKGGEEIDPDRIVYARATGCEARWVAAISDRYKLVYSTEDDPWLFDLEKDFEELINFAEDPEYVEIRKRMTDALIGQLRKTEDPVLEMETYLKWLR